MNSQEISPERRQRDGQESAASVPGGRRGRKDDSARPEWLEYPGGLRLASPMYNKRWACPACKAVQGERHEVTCPHLICPKCGEVYGECDCTDPLLVDSRYEGESSVQLVAIVNDMASEYHGKATRLNGSIERECLVRKARAMEKILALHRAASNILASIPAPLIDRWRFDGNTPRYIEQAFIMERLARQLYSDWSHR